jgi:hypothetical protein
MGERPVIDRAFDAEHDALLRGSVGERFTVLHRLDAHLFEFK